MDPVNTAENKPAYHNEYIYTGEKARIYSSRTPEACRYRRPDLQPFPSGHTFREISRYVPTHLDENESLSGNWKISGDK